MTALSYQAHLGRNLLVLADDLTAAYSVQIVHGSEQRAT